MAIMLFGLLNDLSSFKKVAAPDGQFVRNEWKAWGMGINRFLYYRQVFCGALSQSNRNECDVFTFPVAFFLHNLQPGKEVTQKDRPNLIVTA